MKTRHVLPPTDVAVRSGWRMVQRTAAAAVASLVRRPHASRGGLGLNGLGRAQRKLLQIQPDTSTTAHDADYSNPYCT
jgi:hypothetical protein